MYNDIPSSFTVSAISFTDKCCEPLLLAPMSDSDEVLYVVWPDNKTGNWDIFFIRSMDGGKTFEDPINISNDSSSSNNPSILSFGNHVSISWWDNKTGDLQPLIRSSHDGGKNFDKPILLNTSSTEKDDIIQTPSTIKSSTSSPQNW